MKTVFEGEVVDVLPINKGIIIVYVHDITDNAMHISFKMVSFENGKVTVIPKSVYELSKFGTNYQTISMQAKNYIMSKAILLPNGKYLIVDTDGTTKIVDSEGHTQWTGELKYKGGAPSGIAVSGRTIWACYKESRALVRVNITTMREELRIGGGNASPFDDPTDLFINGEKIYVCNSGTNAVLRVDLNTYAVEEYCKFDSPPKQFLTVDEYQFVVLKSGVYML